MLARTGSSIGPTAHYTGEVWARNGLSHPALSTHAGRLMFHSMRLPMAASKALGGGTLEEVLLARHRLIDMLLEAAIESGEVSQVIEVAAGLSPRGWRFARRFGERLTYVESDLPEMVERKRQALSDAGSPGAGHRLVSLDALSDTGPASIGAIAAELDPAQGTALITEGLLTYLDRDAALGLWRRAARALLGFPHGLMLSDLHLRSENGGWTALIGAALISAFVRRRLEIQFDDAAEATAALEAAGFAAQVELHRGSEVSEEPGAATIRVIEARV
jgi:O-methyltransferase involved in polyketide biosynthesis